MWANSIRLGPYFRFCNPTPRAILSRFNTRTSNMEMKTSSPSTCSQSPSLSDMTMRRYFTSGESRAPCARYGYYFIVGTKNKKHLHHLQKAGATRHIARKWKRFGDHDRQAVFRNLYRLSGGWGTRQAFLNFFIDKTAQQNWQGLGSPLSAS